MGTKEPEEGYTTTFVKGFTSAFNYIFWIIFLFVLFLTYGTIPNRFYQVLIVNSGSMSPTFNAGDLIIITPKPQILQPGMILTMVVNGGVVTHRLVAVTSEGSLITKGDANPVNDNWKNADISVRGLYRFRVPFFGLLLNKPLQWLRSDKTDSWFTDASQMALIISAAWEEPTATPTPTVEAAGCTYSYAYWKNHPERWPVSELALGSRVYSKSEALDLLNASVRGDVTLHLSKQLIGAKLNTLNGADSSTVEEVIRAADDFLTQYSPRSNPQDRQTRLLGNSLAETLDQFNNGEIGPGHCSDDDLAETVEEFVVEDPSPTATPTASIPVIEVTPLLETPSPTNSALIPTQPDLISPTATPTPLPSPTETPTPQPLPTETATPEPSPTEEPAATETPAPVPTQPG